MSQMSCSAFLQSHVGRLASRRGAGGSLYPGIRIGSWRIDGERRPGRASDTYRVVRDGGTECAALTVFDAPAPQLGSYPRRIVEVAQVLRTVDHPGVIDVLNVGQLADGRTYVVTDVDNGSTLAQIVPDGACVSPLPAITILRGVCAPLIAAHAIGVVHGALDFENVFLVEDDERYIKLLDWGLERAVFEEAVRAGFELPRGELCVAPEQTVGVRSPQTDAYALGVLTYRLLFGCAPFTADTPDALHTAQLGTRPDPRRLWSAIPETLEALLCDLLAPDPRSRPAIRSASERFADVAGELAATQPDDPPPSYPRRKTAPFVSPPAPKRNVPGSQPTPDTSWPDTSPPTPEDVPLAAASDAPSMSEVIAVASGRARTRDEDEDDFDSEERTRGWDRAERNRAHDTDDDTPTDRRDRDPDDNAPGDRREPTERRRTVRRYHLEHSTLLDPSQLDPLADYYADYTLTFAELRGPLARWGVGVAATCAVVAAFAMYAVRQPDDRHGARAHQQDLATWAAVTTSAAIEHSALGLVPPRSAQNAPVTVEPIADPGATPATGESPVAQAPVAGVSRVASVAGASSAATVARLRAPRENVAVRTRRPTVSPGARAAANEPVDAELEARNQLLADYQRLGRALLDLRREKGVEATSELWQQFHALEIQPAVATAKSRAATGAVLRELRDKLERQRGISISDACRNNPLADGCR